MEEPDVDGLIGVDAGNAKCMDLDGEKEKMSALQPNQAALETQTELALSKTGAKARIVKAGERKEALLLGTLRCKE